MKSNICQALTVCGRAMLAESRDRIPSTHFFRPVVRQKGGVLHSLGAQLLVSVWGGKSQQQLTTKCGELHKLAVPSVAHCYVSVIEFATVSHHMSES